MQLDTVFFPISVCSLEAPKTGNKSRVFWRGVIDASRNLLTEPARRRSRA